MSFRFNIRLSGAGGHGLIQAARILAEAAAVYDNKNAAESCSYGPEARGNASRAEIIISDEAINSPSVDSIDLLMALTQEAYDKHIDDVSHKGTIVIDSHVKAREKMAGQKLYSAPLMDIAEKTCGRTTMVNIVALGFLAEICDVIGKKSIQHAILARVPKLSEEIYIEAYASGLKTAADLLNE